MTGAACAVRLAPGSGRQHAASDRYRRAGPRLHDLHWRRNQSRCVWEDKRPVSELVHTGFAMRPNSDSYRGEQRIEDDLRAWYQRYDSMSTPVYSVFGNHDGAPVNSFPTWSGTNEEPYWLYQDAASSWNRTIGSEAAAELAALSGCYSRVHPGTRLRIISVNTNYWYKQNCQSRRTPLTSPSKGD